jgi:hypothetical protein
MTSRPTPLGVTGYLLLGALGVAGFFGGLRWRAAATSQSGAAPMQTGAALPPSAFVPTLLARSVQGEPASVALTQPALVQPAVAPPEPERPHPITAAHRRIFEENARIAALDSALDRQDFVALRDLNADYRRAYPEDEQVLQEGYDLIADCLEERTPQVVQAAQRFWQERHSSSLRRYVRRHCLSGAVP